jgi:hypothetical protein
MLSLNMILAINEAASIILKAEDIIGGREFAKLIITLELAIGSALEKEYARGNLSNRILYGIFFEGIKTFAKEVFSKLFTKIVQQGITRVFPRVAGKFMTKTVNVFGKVSSLGKVTERFLPLSNATNLLSPNA